MSILKALESRQAGQSREDIERLARHALGAEAWGEAVTYLRRAAHRAIDRSSYDPAAQWLEAALRALERLSETPETIAQAVDIRLELRVALIPLGRYEDALTAMREAESLALRLGDRGRLGRVLADICARLRNVAGEHLQAIEVGRRALAIAADTGDQDLEREAQYRTGQAYFAIGDFRLALDLLLKCADGAGAGSDQRSKLFASWAHNWLALTLSNLGRFRDARSHADEALRIAEGADHPFTLAETLTGVGSVALAQGDLDRAIAALERARGIISEWNFQPWAVFARLGYAWAVSGRVQEGRDLLEEVRRGAKTMSAMGVGRAMQLAWLGEAYLLEGRLDEALDRTQQGVTLARRHRERSDEAWALHLLGEIAFRRDPPNVEAAEGYYREALALAAELEMRPLVAHVHFDLGKLFRTADRHEQARQHLTSAAAMYGEVEMCFWLDHAVSEMRSQG